MTLKWSTLFLLALVFAFSAVFGEGTKQLMPNSGSDTRILIARGNVSGQQRDPFAVYGEDPEYRLYIHISDPYTEKIYFGVGLNSGAAVNWRIHAPDGSVAWPVPPAPAALTPSAGQPGFIDNYTEAFNGPDDVNPAGYDALSLAPTVSGDYFMTFEIANGQQRDFQFFDITVVNTGSTPYEVLPGRVFSKCWQIRNPQPWTSNKFYGLMYIYSLDGIVTKFDPNGLEGRDFSFSSNESGCYQVNPPIITSTEARRSQTGRHNYPQYKIFLNDPDNTAYPSGTIGELVIPPPPAQAVVTTPYCETGFIDFAFSVTQAGSVQIDLLLNAALGAPYVDRQIVQTVNKFGNVVTWDGYDGAIPPHPVPNNTQFNFTLTYINGMTHLPLYDVESNASGFRVYLVRPPSNNPKFYWDDAHISGGTTNLTGCQSSPSNSCHPWGESQGDQNTINTWWYVSNTSTAPAQITEWRTPGFLGDITGPADVCEGATATYTVPASADATSYNWTTPTGTINTTVPSITIDFTGMPIGSHLLMVQGVNNCGGGPKSTLDVTIHALPVATITGPAAVCLNSVQTYTTQPGMANYNWNVSSGGSITSGAGTNQIGVTWSGTGAQTLSIAYDDPFGCGVPTPAVKNIMVNTNPVPVIAGASTICEQSGATYSTDPGMTGYTWTISSGGAITSGAATNSINVTWSATGAQTVSLVFTDGNGCVAPVPTVFPVTVNPRPVPTITGPAAVCLNTSGTYLCEPLMTAYDWTVSSGGTIQAVQGQTRWISSGIAQVREMCL